MFSRECRGSKEWRSLIAPIPSVALDIPFFILEWQEQNIVDFNFVFNKFWLLLAVVVVVHCKPPVSHDFGLIFLRLITQKKKMHKNINIVTRKPGIESG